MNFLTGDVLKRLPKSEFHGSQYILGARPEALRISNGSLNNGEIELGSMQIELNENLGGQQMLHGFMDKQPIQILADSSDNFFKDQKVVLKIELTKVHIFDKNTGLNTRLS
jgi:ABC-type sugar transport system ATPase subunit